LAIRVLVETLAHQHVFERHDLVDARFIDHADGLEQVRKSRL